MMRLLESPAAWEKAKFEGAEKETGQRSRDGDLAGNWELAEERKERGG